MDAPLRRCATCMKPVDPAEACRDPGDPKVVFCCPEHRDRYLAVEDARAATPPTSGFERFSCLGLIIAMVVAGVGTYVLHSWRSIAAWISGWLAGG